MFWLSCPPGSFVLAVLPWHSLPGCPFLAILSWHLFLTVCPGCPVLAVQSWLVCLCSPVVLVWQSCHGCCSLTPLFSRLWLDYNIFSRNSQMNKSIFSVQAQIIRVISSVKISTEKFYRWPIARRGTITVSSDIPLEVFFLPDAYKKKL